VIGEGLEKPSASSYALRLANESYEWYKTASIRSRKTYRASETALLVVSASIPVVAAISPHNAIIPAILGAGVVIISGAQMIFHWKDNYLRFSAARETVESERRRYHTGAKPYDNSSTRDQNLAESISLIERREMVSWLEMSSRQSDT